jgi:hypothetical protein
MKKMILTMVAMLSMTMAFAENETAASVNNVEAYDMSVNMNKLSDALALTVDQVEAVAEIHHTFAAEMMFAGLVLTTPLRRMLSGCVMFLTTSRCVLISFC